MRNSRIADSCEKTEKALSALKAMVEKPMQSDRSNIDATIQRFEFTIELFWKLLKRILGEKGIDVTYPRDVLQEAYAGHLIDDEEAWLNMLRDRNLTSHTYNEQLADQIYNNIKKYYPVLKKSFDKLKTEFCRTAR